MKNSVAETDAETVVHTANEQKIGKLIQKRYYQFLSGGLFIGLFVGFTLGAITFGL